MTYRCPIDGAELKAGEPCAEHGIAFIETRQDGRVVASAGPLQPKPRRGSAPKPGRKTR